MINKIGIIGCGKVGLSIIHEILTLNLNLELILIDNNKERTLSNINDFNHMLSSTKIKLGSYKDLNDSQVLIITAGIKNNKNRTNFLQDSFIMIDDIMNNILKTSFNGSIIVVSNPNDVLTTYVSKKYEYSKVIGSGCMLDSNRLKYFLSEKYHVPKENVDGIVVGEHGYAQTILWDTVKVNSLPIKISEKEKKVIEDQVLTIADSIVLGKGYTNYGVSSCVVSILKNLLSSKPFSLVASFYHLKSGICYSYPLIYDGNRFECSSCKIDSNLDFCINKIKKEYFIFQNQNNIGIDLDDTITDIQDEMKKYASIFDKEINGKGIVDESKYLVGEMYQWSDLDKDKFFLTYRRKIIENAKLRKSVIKTLKKWQELGYKIYIITARSKKYYTDPYKDTYNFLKHHHVPFDKLIVDSTDKKDICFKYKINFFVDDMPNNCMLVNELANVKVFIMDNGNNYCSNKEIIRVKSFQEMDEVIQGVSEF